MTRNPAKLAAFIRIVASIILALALVALGSPAGAAPSDQDPCAAQRAALNQVNQQIDAHNAEPHVFVVPEELAAFKLYDAEAAELNLAGSQVVSSLQTCEETLGALADEGPNSLPLKTQAPEKLRNDLNNEKAKIPTNFKPNTSADQNGYWRVPRQIRALYELLRKRNPGQNLGEPYLQGEPRPQIGDPDPAYPGKSIAERPRSGSGPSPDVKADHIVPMAELVNLPGFLELNADNMYIVSRAPLNLQWLSEEANNQKSSKSVADMDRVDPTWQAGQVALQNSVRAQLQEIIQRLIASQH